MEPLDNDRSDSTPDLPATSRGFSTQELEAVIRRAVELQSGTPSRADDGLSEHDIVRIGQEIGLEPAMVRRAMADVRSSPPEEHGALATIVGPGTARAARVLRRPAASTGLLVDRHLRESELMVAQRRFPDRTRYVRDASIAAGLTRFARGFSRAHKPLDVQQLDVAVSALDADSCLLELRVDLGAVRAGLLAGVLGTGTAAAAAWTVVVFATAIVDPLALVGLPVAAGSWAGTRAIYGVVRRDLQEKLEGFLDRVEHGEVG